MVVVVVVVHRQPGLANCSINCLSSLFWLSEVIDRNFSYFLSSQRYSDFLGCLLFSSSLLLPFTWHMTTLEARNMEGSVAQVAWECNGRASDLRSRGCEFDF